MSDPGEVTRLLVAYREGDREAFDRLVPLVYQDLRRIARAHLRRMRAGHTLDTTGLVHEAYLRMVDQTRAEWVDRQHFLSVCARAMRQIVVSNARRHGAAKRGGGDRRVTLDEERIAEARRAEWLVALDRALERLGSHNERLVRVVECRYFAGLSEQETAAALDSSLRTVQRDWTRARAWLREELGGQTDGMDSGPGGA
ncbi:MAG TPA: sigma-70 family RNA polymerase sigma factor [Candidatus Polarisedimenticolaceae bacterium]|nr:sigma-70 family RNA polymerase sigma factor [Candidatus Polarisedimenticolaceae bacterium]